MAKLGSFWKMSSRAIQTNVQEFTLSQTSKFKPPKLKNQGHASKTNRQAPTSTKGVLEGAGPSPSIIIWNFSLRLSQIRWQEKQGVWRQGVEIIPFYVCLITKDTSHIQLQDNPTGGLIIIACFACEGFRACELVSHVIVGFLWPPVVITFLFVVICWGRWCNPPGVAETDHGSRPRKVCFPSKAKSTAFHVCSRGFITWIKMVTDGHIPICVY